MRCQRCRGEGAYYTTLRDLAGRGRDGFKMFWWVPCDAPGCVNGQVDREAYYRAMGIKQIA